MPATPILPASQRISVSQRRGTLSARQLDAHDAAIVLCLGDDFAALRSQLPYAGLWSDLAGAARRRGPVTQLSARVGNRAHTLVSLASWNAAATPFAKLTLAARLWKELGATPAQRVLFATVGLDAAEAAVALEALTAAALAGAAPLPSFKSKRAPPAALRTLDLLHAGQAVDLDLVQARHAGNHLARWLTVLPPDRLNCLTYRRALRDLAGAQGWGFRFYDEAALRRLGAGAFLAVSRSNAHRGAGIVRLTYRPKRAARKARRLALVGKGICFDTGGINLKPHKSMYQMHEDMQGSAVAVGTLLALSELAVPFAIDCWLALTENEIGPMAYRPQEVVTALNGTTIQVVHSDAEGRMVLADTLALAAREAPAAILDFATLTGACVMALTERYSGVFTNRADWRPMLETAGRESGERVWNFPMDDDFDGDLDTPVADVLQCTMDGKGDHILAARFLNRFVPAAIPWVHVDLSASNHRGGLGYVPSDFTGFGVRFATQLALRHPLLA